MSEAAFEAFEAAQRGPRRDAPDPRGAEKLGVLELTLQLRDPEVVEELTAIASPREREQYAVTALRVGLLSLRTARGQVDGETVRREVDAMLQALEKNLVQHRDALQLSLGSALREYFDPKSGRFAERVQALTDEDGELARVMRSQVEGNDSALARTLGAHLGPESPVMRSLDPQNTDGLLPQIHQALEEALRSQRERILGEFSLDNREGALTRLVGELTSHHGKLAEAMESRIDEVVREFSLDEGDSALSRLVQRVERAQQRITDEFTLDSEDSALARMRGELLRIAERQTEKIAELERRVASEMAALGAKRLAESQSTTHGHAFEAELLGWLRQAAAGAGDLLRETGTTPGRIRHCKVGDAVVELGTGHKASGARIVIEAKEKAGYGPAQAQEELETARKNRDAEFGIAVLSARAAPEGARRFYPLAGGVLVIWDAEDARADVFLEAALALARASCLRARARADDRLDIAALDRAVRQVEKQIEGLDEIRTTAETIERGSGRILRRVRILSENLARAVSSLDRSAEAAKELVGE